MTTSSRPRVARSPSTRRWPCRTSHSGWHTGRRTTGQGCPDGVRYRRSAGSRATSKLGCSTARLLLGLGRLSEAFEQLRAARREDPASALVLSCRTIAYFVAGQVDSALRREPSRTRDGFHQLHHARRRRGGVPCDQQPWRTSTRLLFCSSDGNLSRGYYLVMSGDTAGARELLRRLDARPPVWGDQTQRAFTILGLGDTAGALAALERATNAREHWPIYPSVADRMFRSDSQERTVPRALSAPAGDTFYR